MTMRNQRFNAKLIALRISPSFSLDKVVIRDPMFDFETVCYVCGHLLGSVRREKILKQSRLFFEELATHLSGARNDGQSKQSL